MDPLLLFFFPTIVVSSWLMTFCRECIAYNGNRQSYAAFKKFIEAGDRLEKWRMARPFLFVGQSAYARSLVRAMIDAYLTMLDNDHELDRRVLEDLYDLLNEIPPPHNPPANEKARSGGLSFLSRRTNAGKIK